MSGSGPGRPVAPHAPASSRREARWTREQYARGDYAGAAMWGDPSTFEHHAGRAMLLGDAASFAALREWTSPEARFALGAALWVHGDDAAAARELAGSALPHARRLLGLVRQERIQVLAQLPWLRGAATDLVSGIAADPRFVVRNVGHHALDVRNRPYANVASFLDQGFRPDLYVAAMVEWHHLPPDLQTLPCPILGHVADHDLHVQTLAPWLPLFDELLVTDHSEWCDVQGLATGPVASFPKVFGLPADLAPLPDLRRWLDVFVSGTLLDPFHPDKAALVHELLSMEDLDLRIVRGFAGKEAYDALLAASRVSFTYVRRPGALPTRGLESLAMGCAVALQRESVLNLFVGREHGVATYGNEQGDLAACLRAMLREYDHYGPAARAGAARVREEFDLRRVASQYFRFLCVRATAERGERRLADAGSLVQHRICVRKTWLPDDAVVRRRTMQANFRVLRDRFAARPTAALLNGMARELVCEFAWYDAQQNVGEEERALFEDALGLWQQGVRAFPSCLVLRFNLVRAALHHGSPAQRMQALQLAWDTLQHDVGHWQVGPRDDVMPFDAWSDTFDYRGYLTLATDAEKGVPVPAGEFARRILASLAGYLARTAGVVDWHRAAVAMDPGFARYRLDLARALLVGGPACLHEDDDAERRGAEVAEAVALLEGLAAGSVVFDEAARLLAEVAPDRSAGRTALRRLEEDALDASLGTRSLFAIERRAKERAQQFSIRRDSGQSGPRVSILVPWPGGERELAALLGDLQAQTIAQDLEVIVAVDGAAAAAMVDAFADAPLAVRRVDVAPAAPHARRLDACAHAAAAPLLGIALPDERFRADAFELLAGELRAHPQSPYAFANTGLREVATAEFALSSCAALVLQPPFAVHRLFAVDLVGTCVVWRRALHDQHGGFDAAAGPAAEYEFWLRVAQDGAPRQRREVLATRLVAAPWRSLCDPAADPAAAERARARHWPAALGPRPRVRTVTPVPAALLSTSLRVEAESHAQLGILTLDDRRQVAALEEFLGTALLHGDLAVAELLLRSCVERHPELLSARFALAALLRALGDPTADDVLRGAAACEPYRPLVRRRLARAGRHTQTRPEPIPLQETLR